MKGRGPIVHLFPGSAVHHLQLCLHFAHETIRACLQSDSVEQVDLVHGGVEAAAKAQFEALSREDSTRLLYAVGGTSAIISMLRELNPRLIIIHGLFIGHFWRHIVSVPWLWRRILWVAWGGDLEWLEDETKTRFGLAARLKRRALLHAVLPRLGAVGVLTPEDGDTVCRMAPWARNVRPIRYPALKVLANLLASPPTNGTRAVICGNSASENNRHTEIIDWVRHLNGPEFTWVFPLGYGGEETAQRVASYGQSTLGSSFVALRQLLPADEYTLLFRSAFALVLNYPTRKQQGLGNICLALQLGTKIFLRHGSPLHGRLEAWGAHVYDALALPTMTREEFLAPMPPSWVMQNRRVFEQQFSREAASEQWRQFLEGLV